MAVKDIVAGAEMFLRTAGIADENIRRQLLKKIQDQALIEKEEEFGRLQEYQKKIPDIIQSSYGPSVEGAYGYGPMQQGEFDVNKFVQGIAPFLTPPQAATAGVGAAKVMDPSTAFTNKMLLLQYANSLKGEKPVGQASWYDSLGVELFGSEYNTPVGQKKMADWVKEHPNEAKLAQYNYTLRNTAPYAPTMQTGTGFQQMPDTKHPGGIGVPGVSVAPSTATPVKDVSGQPVGKALDANSIQELEDSRTTYQIMSEIKDTFEKPEFAGQTGPIQGMWNKIKVKFMQDGDIQYAINQLESLITIAYSLTGKQASYNEMQNLKKALLPQLTQPHANFMATLNATQNWLQKNYTNRVSGYKQSGYSFNLPDTIDNKKSQTTSRFSEGGKTWNIPADKIQAFKANHPNAKEVR